MSSPPMHPHPDPPHLHSAGHSHMPACPPWPSTTSFTLSYTLPKPFHASLTPLLTLLVHHIHHTSYTSIQPYAPCPSLASLTPLCIPCALHQPISLPACLWTIRNLQLLVGFSTDLVVGNQEEVALPSNCGFNDTLMTVYCLMTVNDSTLMTLNDSNRDCRDYHC